MISTSVKPWRFEWLPDVEVEVEVMQVEVDPEAPGTESWIA